LCELVAVSAIRSEFDAADKVGLSFRLHHHKPSFLSQELDVLIAHTRTWGLFDEFSARIALHHAHLAHSLGKNTETSAYYTVASHLSEPSSFVDIAATLGRAQLFIGLSAHSPSSPVHGSGESVTRLPSPANMNEEEISAFASRAVRLTKGMGGTLEAAGKVIQAATCAEILRAK
jgi:hypothetical protein